jgi:hypothetical protein
MATPPDPLREDFPVDKLNLQCYLFALFSTEFHMVPSMLINDALFNRNDTMISEMFKNIIVTRPPESDEEASSNWNAVDSEVLQFFSKLTTAQVAALQPKIDLAYVTSTRERKKQGLGSAPKGGGTVKNIKEVPIRFPVYHTHDRAIVYNTGPPDYVATGHEEQFSDIGSGIKSMTIDHRPENPSDNTLIVTLDLFFENIVSLTKSEIINLIRTPKGSIKTEGTIEVSELILKFGWNAPLDFVDMREPGSDISSLGGPVEFSDFSSSDIGALERASQTVLLQLVQHNLKFNQNGSIDLQIQYQGGFERAAEDHSADLFGLNDIREGELKEIETRWQAAADKRESLLNSTKILTTKSAAKLSPSGGSAGTIDLNDTTPELKKIEDEIKELTSAYTQKRNNYMRLAQMDFLQSLIGAAGSRAEDTGDTIGVYFFDVPMEALLYTTDDLLSKYKGLSFPGKYSKDPQVLITPEATYRIHPNGNVVNWGGPGTPEAKWEDVSLSDKAKQNLRSYMQEWYLRNNVNSGDGVYDPTLVTDTLKLEAGMRRIYFTTLGRIVDLAASNFVNGSGLADSKEVILGTLSYDNPFKGGAREHVSLASLPISIEAFVAWFTENFASENYPRISFHNFVNRLIKDFVNPYLAGNVCPMLYSLTSDINPILSSKTVLGHGKNLPTRGTYMEYNENIPKPIFDVQYENLREYFHIFVSLNTIQGGTHSGMLEDDSKRGIFHVVPAQSAGVVKAVEFERIDMQHLRASRMVNIEHNEPGTVLRERYNATVKMIGNSLFKGGDIIYIDPVFMGDLGRIEFKTLGVGGYYLVLSVKNRFSGGNFETTMKAFWVSDRDKLSINSLYGGVSLLPASNLVGPEGLRDNPFRKTAIGILFGPPAAGGGEAAPDSQIGAQPQSDTIYGITSE